MHQLRKSTCRLTPPLLIYNLPGRNEIPAAYPLEVVCDLKLVLLPGQLGLDLRVGVVDDREEHVEQDEEDKEDVEDKVERAEYAVGHLEAVEVKLTEDDAELGESDRVQGGRLCID